jgi:arginine decarboxylase
LIDVIKEYGTPLKISYLPKIRSQIRKSRDLFNKAIEKHKYKENYVYCYCTKASHFRFVLDEVIDCGVDIETSSAFDLEIIRNLQKQGRVDKDLVILCNGFKRPLYTQYISEMINDGFKNCVPILDNLDELEYYENHIEDEFRIGVRMASDEEPNFEFYTSRLGIRYSEITEFYTNRIKKSGKAKLKVLHFFINTGIKDTAYYWSELSRFMYTYCNLKKICPDLDTIDIGGGFPIKTSLAFEFDYEYMIDQIIENIKWICDKNHVPHPRIVTEFGNYTVGESGAVIYSILNEKQQNDKELWYMIDGSFITHIPDTWGTNQKFVLLPVNNWNMEYHKVNIGGLTCDHMDYYNSESHSSEVFLPVRTEDQPLYIGFFHTGAYQESIGGYGGIQHCLIPAPKHVLINRDEDGVLSTRLFAEEQESSEMLNILGYRE